MRSRDVSQDRGPGPGPPAPGPVRARLQALAPAAVIGHRGAGKTRPDHPWPENSLASFLAAVRRGADGVELDVTLTRDERLVVLHDDTLERTTDGSGAVSRLLLEEVRRCRILDAAGRPTREPPPTLEEAFRCLPPHVLINVELKPPGSGRRAPGAGAALLARTAVREVIRLGGGARALFSSFDEEAAAAVKREAPSLYAGLLLTREASRSWEPALARAAAHGLDAVHPHHWISAAGVEAARRAGLQVNVYTVNGRPRMRTVLDRGVTSIITDEPGLLRAVVQERRAAGARG